MTASSQLAHIKPLIPDLAPASPVEARDAPATRFTGHWEELLWDLACLDPVWIETSATGVALRQAVELHGIRVADDMGIAEGATFGLYCFLDDWHALRPRTAEGVGDPTGFDIEDRDREPLLSLAVDGRAHAFALRVLMATYQAGSGRVVPFRRYTQRAPRLAKHLRDLVTYQETSAEPLNTGDIAEACGWLTLTPARMQVRGRVRLAATELVPCFIEAVAEQALAVRVLTGSASVAQSHRGCLHSYRRRRDDWVELASERAQLMLELSAIDSAWVLERPTPEGTRHQLRLYDDHGRALLLMDDLSSAEQPESPLWRTLIKALLD